MRPWDQAPEQQQQKNNCCDFDRNFVKIINQFREN